jgi:hypothetical protein
MGASSSDGLGCGMVQLVVSTVLGIEYDSSEVF